MRSATRAATPLAAFIGRGLRAPACTPSRLLSTSLLSHRMPVIPALPVARIPLSRMSGLKLTTHKGTAPAPPAAPSAAETDVESDVDADEPSAPPLDLSTVGPDYFHLSDSTVARLTAQRATQGPAHGLRVIVDTGGCSGFQYQFHPAQLPLDPADAAAADSAAADSAPRVTRSDDLPDELVFRRGGAAVAVDSISLPFLKGATLDYKTELIRAGFAVVENPNVDLACGCGTSFSRKGAK